MSTVNALKWIALTAAINAIKSPNSFLQKLLYPRHQTLEVETIELGTISAGRDIAPMVKANGEAVLIGGTSKSFLTVAGPNIRIKQPFTPSELLYGREPGNALHIDQGASIIPTVEQHIARDLQYQADMVTNNLEWLVAMSLQGTIQYILEDGEAFTITIPRSSDNVIVMSTFLNDATPANVRVLALINLVKHVMADAEGLSPTDAICGSEAAAALMELAESGNMKWLGVDFSRMQVGGGMSFVEQFRDDGVIFLGELGGVRFWQYSRTANLNGVAKDMIRPKYIEFVSTSTNSDRVLYFAAIPDMDALQGRKIRSERFSKSWIEKDPSRMMALTHSRPMPWPRKPNATVSVKAVSG